MIKQLGAKFVQLYDHWNSRWMNVWANVAMLAVFLPVAFFLKEGWARDMWFFAAGTFAGYTFMWLVAPRFNAARKHEMEVEMATSMAGLYEMIHKRAGEFEVMLKRFEDDNGKPGRLQ